MAERLTRLTAKPIEDLTPKQREGTVKVLKGILGIYRKPSAWTKRALADHTRGEVVRGSPEWAEIPTKEATTFCLVGAARKVDTQYEPHALRALAQVIGTRSDDWDQWNKRHPYPASVFIFNDEASSVSEVRDVIRKTIAAVKRGRV